MTFLRAHWPALLAAISGLTCAAVSFITAEPPTTVSERCEAVEMPERCSAEECGAIEQAECERFHGPSVAMSYCKVER